MTKVRSPSTRAEPSAYIPWEVKFGLAAAEALDIYLWAGGTIRPRGLHTTAADQHAGAMQETLQREWAYGELVQALQLDEHVQLVLEFKGDSETPPSPHEAMDDDPVSVHEGAPHLQDPARRSSWAS